MNDPQTIIGRLAPSPTGAQHLGNARTYLIAWLMARSHQGTLFLRMEDIDSPRVKPWAAQQAIDDLKWLGLDWDGEVLVQTERFCLYHQALEELKKQELVYPCTCTRSEVLQAASAPHEDGREPVYPGTCSHRQAADANNIQGKPFCWRFRLPPREPDFHDGFHGFIPGRYREQSGDFVIWRMGDTAGQSVPAYQLAVVVDDAAQGINQVVRGDDLIPSTPRQLLLYKSLGLAAPRYFHVPLVVGEDGRRLAKRHGDTRISTLREQGVSAEKILGLLAWSCGWLPTMEPITAGELLSFFDLKTIPRRPFVLGKEHFQSIGYTC
ncbi:MAG: tRNA glutamyl-Q(34) synthetase GluQRS [Gemmataceae bacterium]